MHWLVPYSALTPSQQNAVMLDTVGPRAIVGGPGAGKTLVLLHRLAYLYQKAGGRRGSVHMFVYTTTLKDFIRSAFVDLDLPPDTVTTFDKWCKDTYRQHVSHRVPHKRIGERMIPDFDRIRVELLAAIQGGKAKVPRYDAVLVDEAQDLDLTAFAIIRSVARHVTVALDEKQQLFDGRPDESTVLTALGLQRSNASLIDGLRCNQRISNLASHFIKDARKREEFKRQARNANSTECPLLYVARDHEDEKRHLAEMISVKVSSADRDSGGGIAVLFPQSRMVHGYAIALRSLGIDVVTDSRSGIDFGDPRPKVLSYHEAKGLTFDSVFLPRLDTVAFKDGLSARVNQLLFVGVTRAASWAYLSGQARRLLAPVADLATNPPADYLAVRHSGAGRPTPNVADGDDWIDDVPL
ncbi:MAG: hypothetical protein AMXMBFR72_11800 [Betaproteobacteria bacterium]